MADPQGAPEGQSAPQIPSGTTESSDPFFSYKFADGKEEVYKTKEELSKAYRDSFLRQSDYTKKTQEAASVKKQIEEERKKFLEDQKQFLESRKKYDQWDSILKTRPDIYSQLERAASAPPDASSVYDRSKGYVDERYSALEGQLKEMKAALDKEKTQKELNDTFAKFKTKYDDFDEGPIMERLEYLSNGETEPLIDLLYWATKGQMTPAKEAEIEERVAENFAKKKTANMVSTKGTGIKPPSKAYRNLDEARRAAFEDAGIHL